MVCQNCGLNEATTHIKRVINGEMAETHLCPGCAAGLGYGDFFSGFGLNLGEIFSGLIGSSSPPLHGEVPVKRCRRCGCSFEDIAREGKVGCADCYRTFYDTLLPSLQRIHGRIHHNGKVAAEQGEDNAKPRQLEKLKDELREAVNEQNFELAATLRDQIKELEKED